MHCYTFYLGPVVFKEWPNIMRRRKIELFIFPDCLTQTTYLRTQPVKTDGTRESDERPDSGCHRQDRKTTQWPRTTCRDFPESGGNLLRCSVHGTEPMWVNWVQSNKTNKYTNKNWTIFFIWLALTSLWNSFKDSLIINEFK